MKPEPIKKTVHVETNVDEIKEKVDQLQQKLEEANSIIQELASMKLEVHLDV